jgi:hypothetical protein
MQRRTFITAAGFMPMMGWFNTMQAKDVPPATGSLDQRVLTDFAPEEPYIIEGAGWRGFSDRVMGGMSNVSLNRDTIAGKNCARLTGTVTRESNGGFIQMALYFGADEAELDGSAYSGLELLVYGNNEDYNVHLRTADCGWYDQSYRYTFFAKPEWQRVRIKWSEFEANSVTAAFNSARINRIAILGWMREFQADIALARLSLYA